MEAHSATGGTGNTGRTSTILTKSGDDTPNNYRKISLARARQSIVHYEVKEKMLWCWVSEGLDDPFNIPFHRFNEHHTHTNFSSFDLSKFPRSVFARAPAQFQDVYGASVEQSWSTSHSPQKRGGLLLLSISSYLNWTEAAPLGGVDDPSFFFGWRGLTVRQPDAFKLARDWFFSLPDGSLADSSTEQRFFNEIAKMRPALGRQWQAGFDGEVPIIAKGITTKDLEILTNPPEQSTPMGNAEQSAGLESANASTVAAAETPRERSVPAVLEGVMPLAPMCDRGIELGPDELHNTVTGETFEVKATLPAVTQESIRRRIIVSSTHTPPVITESEAVAFRAAEMTVRFAEAEYARRTAAAASVTAIASPIMHSFGNNSLGPTSYPPHFPSLAACAPPDRTAVAEVRQIGSAADGAPLECGGCAGVELGACLLHATAAAANMAAAVGRKRPRSPAPLPPAPALVPPTVQSGGAGLGRGGSDGGGGNADRAGVC
jgi:hypothetical protein